MSWRELEHSADIRLEIEAETIEELVTESAKAFYGASEEKQPAAHLQEVRGEISLRGPENDVSSLLVLWMNELLFFLETTHRVFIPREVSINPVMGTLAVSGKWVPSSSAGSRVKAVTYGGLELETQPRLTLRIILDV